MALFCYTCLKFYLVLLKQFHQRRKAIGFLESSSEITLEKLDIYCQSRVFRNLSEDFTKILCCTALFVVEDFALKGIMGKELKLKAYSIKG